MLRASVVFLFSSKLNPTVTRPIPRLPADGCSAMPLFFTIVFKINRTNGEALAFLSGAT